MANTTPGWSGGYYGAPGGGAGPPPNGYYSSLTPPSSGGSPSTGGWVDPSGTGMTQSQYESQYGTPNQQGAAAGAAGAAASAAGNAQVNNPNVNPTLANTKVPGATSAPGFMSGPGYGEAFEAAHGNDLTGPSNSQTLYDQGVAATNPYYANAMKTTNAGIDMAEAARGEGNSGAALAEIGTADANLSGQQALAQENLAGQADTAATARFTAASGAANNAETQTNNRGNSAASAYAGLSSSQAQTVDNFYQMAETGQLTGDMASIEAQLAASGVDAATAQAITNDLLQVGGIAAKAGSGGK